MTPSVSVDPDVYIHYSTTHIAKHTELIKEILEILESLLFGYGIVENSMHATHSTVHTDTPTTGGYRT